ncbi:MAG: CYTH domain-containing protein [Bacteroidales bacterium]|nr:CYTH domain-containing protein [Bacteroidales bacterium]
MGFEIERKFLVTGDFKHLAIKEINILQGYLSVEPERVIRVRITENESCLTIKSTNSGEGFYKRKEWNIMIDHIMAEELMKVCLPGRIVKTRYIVPYRNHKFEVDVFHGANEGLIIAELELSHENEEFEKPDWLGKEVTGDPSYYNSNLLK